MRRKFAKIALTTLTAAAMVLGVSEASQAESESKSAVAGISVSLSNYYENTEDSNVNVVSNALTDVGTSNKTTKASKETEESTKASKETEESTKASKETEESTKASKETEESTKDSKKETSTEDTKSTDKKDSSTKKTSSDSIYSNLVIAQVDSYVNVRSSADATDSDNIIGKIYNECVASVIDEVKDDDGELWYEISSGSIKSGYVKAEFFVTGDEAEELAKKVTTVEAIVATESLNVREKASVKSDVVASVYEGEAYKVTSDKEEDFVKIQVSDDVSGYVSRDYVDIEVSYPEAITLKEEKNRMTELNKIQDQIESELEAYVEYRDAGDYYSALDEAKYILEIAQDMQDKAEYYQLGDYISAAVDSVENAEYAVKVMNLAISYAEGTADTSAQVVVPEQAAAEHEAEIGAAADTAASAQQAAAAPAADTASTAAAAAETAAPVTVPSSSNGAAAASYATSWIGVCGYVYGGTNLSVGGGVDCSGFTQQVYAAFGVSLPHSSAAQSGAGVAVSADQLQPGDLVFYPGPAGGNTVGHVSIYIGGGQVVHAASPTSGICTASVNFKTILACRRVLN